MQTIPTRCHAVKAWSAARGMLRDYNEGYPFVVCNRSLQIWASSGALKLGCWDRHRAVGVAPDATARASHRRTPGGKQRQPPGVNLRRSPAAKRPIVDNSRRRHACCFGIDRKPTQCVNPGSTSNPRPASTFQRPHVLVTCWAVKDPQSEKHARSPTRGRPKVWPESASQSPDLAKIPTRIAKSVLGIEGQAQNAEGDIVEEGDGGRPGGGQPGLVAVTAQASSQAQPACRILECSASGHGQVGSHLGGDLRADPAGAWFSSKKSP